MTSRALFRSIDRDVGGKPGNGFFEGQRQRHLDIGAALWLWTRCFTLRFCATATEQIGEDVFETGATTAGGCRTSCAPIKTVKVEPPGAEPRTGPAAGRGAASRRVGQVI